ncbi:DNA-binding transcriptional regulator, LysR family [Thermanaeromonas toyohensis ToBE]|uniref:DNA-binding transcriptional regulator, LysR family n=1 Tax=Thermanaeromonas toyohensis ToBE TaxID=698762 RepID=A0A1W1VZF9_9FIRM|nr:DNA-binding transcriptional regulator, LysR family [Thermanaeromonas toyohensis ToBE]
MTLRQLRTFCCVVEEGAFRRAAERLFMTQPAVSQQINTLERYYGIKLFVRRGRKLSLTPEGRFLYELAKQILSTIDEIPARFEEIRSAGINTISIGASSLTGTYILPTAVNKYRRLYPGDKISLEIGYAQDIIQKLRERQLDFGFLGKNPSWSEDGELEFLPVGKDKLVFVVWPGHKWADRDMVMPGELQEETFIHSKQGSGMRALVEAYLQKEGVAKPNSIVEMGNIEAIKKGVANRLGVTIVSYFGVREEILRNELIAVPLLRLDKVSRDFVLVHHRDRKLNSSEIKFYEILREVIAK